MRIHEAGALHADISSRGPGWLRPPSDVNDLVAALWSKTAAKTDGVLGVGGVQLSQIAKEFGTPAFVFDELDFRLRARGFRDAFAPAKVFYAAKAFVCAAVVRIVEEEGLNLDVCSAGELSLALRSGMPASRIGYHGNNKTTAELQHAVDVGVGRIVVDSFDEIDRLAALAASRPVGAAAIPVMIRVTAGVEAHTHEYIATAHEDQKFGFSLASGAAFAAAQRLLALEAVEVLGLHSHIGSQIFDTAGFEVAARRVVGLHARISESLGATLKELDLGGGFGIAYTTQDDPAEPDQLATELLEIVNHECRAHGVAVPQLSIEPGRAIVGPAMCTLYTVGTVKTVQLDAGASRLYVSVDGGMSDNIRTALYDADYSATLAARASEAPPVISRVVGKHCEAGDIVVKDEFLPGDLARGDLLAVPATGAYCRALSSNYNHALRPPVIAVADGSARAIIRRETEADLFATDMGLDPQEA